MQSLQAQFDGLSSANQDAAAKREQLTNEQTALQEQCQQLEADLAAARQRRQEQEAAVAAEYERQRKRNEAIMKAMTDVYSLSRSVSHNAHACRTRIMAVNEQGGATGLISVHLLTFCLLCSPSLCLICARFDRELDTFLRDELPRLRADGIAQAIADTKTDIESVREQQQR